MNKYMAVGFCDEMEKLSGSLEESIKGLGVGAVVGAILSAVGSEALERLVTRNKDLAILTGAIMGAGALGSAGFMLGGLKDPVTNVTESLPAPGSVFHGPPPPGTSISSLRHI